MLKTRLPNNLKTFGDRLKWVVEHDSHFRSQADLARMMGVTPAYIGELAGKDLAPGKKKLAELSEKLNVPESWLAYGVSGDGVGGVDHDAEFWSEYKRIQELPISETMKSMKVETLNSALRQLTQKDDAAAARERNRLMELELRVTGERQEIVERDSEATSPSLPLGQVGAVQLNSTDGAS